METVIEANSSAEENGWDSELNLSMLCRICASPNEYLLPIFQGEGIEHELQSKINKHLPIKVTEDDKLPLHLCYQCASTLIAWHDLVVACLESDKKLREYLIDDDNKENFSEVVEDGIVNNTTTVENTNSVMVLNQIEMTEDFNAMVEHEVNSSKLDEPENKNNADMCRTLDEKLIPTLSSNSRGMVIVKEDNIPDIISIPSNENLITAVEVYEDVETSVVVHDFVEDFQSGHNIAYIDNEYIESSVEIENNESVLLDVNEDSKPLICDECGKIFTNLSLFKHHLNTHQNRHYCQYCDANYKRIDHLHKHIEIMHPNSNCVQIPKEKRINPYAKTFLCNTCGKILKSSIAYENHTLKHQSKCPYTCSMCSDTFPNRGARRRHEVKVHNLLTKENGNPDGYHICEVCGLEMFSDGAYYHHKDKHGDPYPCGFCGKLYGSRSLMQVHARRHTNERPFVCSLCNRNFKVKQELNAHMNIHKDLRPYQCPHCPKMCRKSSDLTHHIRTHTGEKPYICDKCGRGFAQAGDMRKHRLLHFRPSKLNKSISLESK